MTTTQMTQTDEDDMPVYISIYDRPKRPVGRPRNKIQLTEEEKRTYEKNSIKALL